MLLPCEQFARGDERKSSSEKGIALEHIGEHPQHETHIPLLCHKGLRRGERDALPVETVTTHPGQFLEESLSDLSAIITSDRPLASNRPAVCPLTFAQQSLTEQSR